MRVFGVLMAVMACVADDIPPHSETISYSAHTTSLRGSPKRRTLQNLFGQSTAGANERIDRTSYGELEVAVSTDGLNVVVALQNRIYAFSNDGGASFRTGPRIGNMNANGDPSVAYGQSGAFYIAWIDLGCMSTYGNYTNPPMNMTVDPFGRVCTGLARSDDNGVSFATTTVNPPIDCIACTPLGNTTSDPPGCCFPDQEHIAADRFNPGTSGGDQVYSTWRDFDSRNNVTRSDGKIVCSEDSGVTWGNEYDLKNDTDALFPRITVGRDGFVYVAAFGSSGYLVWKFSSCSTGLVRQPNFPQVVATPIAPYVCPFAGHDRCDQNPSSQTVVVDDTDPNHVYYAYAEDVVDSIDVNNTYSRILLHDSTDGGLNWSQPVEVSGPVDARRIFPWLCATGGDAILTWFESVGPVPSDTVDHVGGRAGLNETGDLVSKETFTISEVPDNWCAIGWPRGTRNASNEINTASDSCPIQPQLAGVCRDINGTGSTPCDFSDCGGVSSGVGMNCTCNMTVPETCQLSLGQPKYGDYNGNACIGGKLFAAWPSFASPPGVLGSIPGPLGNTTGILFDVVNLAVDIPIITIPGSIQFENICFNGNASKTLNVCNTGKVDLQVDVITSNNTAFSVTVPSSGFPVTISPDFCFPFEVIFMPSGAGPSDGVLSIPSNDPTRSTVEIDVSGSASVPNLITVMDTDFGRVCLTDSKTQSLFILNDDALCALTISDISIIVGISEFGLAPLMSYPVLLQPGESLIIDVEFTPLNITGAKFATLEIDSNDPDQSVKRLVLSGFAPAAVSDAFMVNSGDFGEVCSGDLRDLDLIVVNNGECPLLLEEVLIELGINAQTGDFVQPVGNVSSSVLSSGVSMAVPIRFAPATFDNDPPLLREALVRVKSRTQFAILSLPDKIVNITGSVPPPDIQWSIPNSGDFGNVCKDNVEDLVLTLFNQGKCDLNITSISFLGDSDEFELPNGPTFPLILSPDADFAYPLRFSPSACFNDAMTETILINSNDPDEDEVEVFISGTSPCPNLIIDPAAPFTATVVDTTGTLGCFTDGIATLRNNGLCPLTIRSMTATGIDYNVIKPTVFPIILPPGEETLTTTVRFTPQSDADPLAPGQVDGMLTVVSDDPGSPHSSALCGESVAQSGVRILVTDISTGRPSIVDEIDLLLLFSKGIFSPSSISLRFKDHPVNSTSICGNTIYYHVNQESLPSTDTTDKLSSYTTKAKEGSLKTSQKFTLGQCEFRDYQLQLKDADGDGCLLAAKGEPCSNDGECCSFKCASGLFGSGGMRCK